MTSTADSSRQEKPNEIAEDEGTVTSRSRDIGDFLSERHALASLGNPREELEDYQHAIDHYQQALNSARQTRAASAQGSPVWTAARRAEGEALGNLGKAHLALGETERAIHFCKQSLDIAREMRSASTEGSPEWTAARHGEATCLGNLGLAYSRLGMTRKASNCFQQALTASRDIGDRRNEGAHLANLGHAHATLGEIAHARSLWTQALAVYEAIQDPRAERVRVWLAELDG